MKSYFLLFFVLVFSSIISAQKNEPANDGIESYYTNAEEFFKNESYLDALPLYLKLSEQYPKVLEYKLKSGICYLYKTDETEKAIEFLLEVKNKKSSTPNINYYLGRAYCLNYKLDEGIQYFTEALNNKKTTDAQKNEINLRITQANNAKEAVNNPVQVTLNNLGSPVNTPFHEYSPLITSDQKTLFFTYRGEKSVGGLQDEFFRPSKTGKYFEDIFISNNIDGKWSEPTPLPINTKHHEATVSITPDGQTLLYYIDSENSWGDIFSTTLEGENWSQPERMAFNSQEWEGSATFSPDKNTIYFSSERGGGLGGKDIWKSTLDENGFWTEPVNLGPTINSKFDEDGCFLHPDGRTLYFSSNGEKSLGGYDIFETKLSPEGNWQTPRNLGYPVNTTGDDIYFTVSGNGEKGYYSSARKDGLGGQDIYILDVKDIVSPETVVLVKGIVTLDDSIVPCKIRVKTANSEYIFANLNNNNKTGEYKVNLPVGLYYVIMYEVEGMPVHIETIDLDTTSTYKEIIKDVKLRSKTITISGNVYYKENPLVPANNIMLMLYNNDSVLIAKKRTDENGFFEFAYLNPEKKYLIEIDENDPFLKIDSNMFLSGKVLLNGLPAGNIFISETITQEDGTFRLRLFKNHHFKKLLADNSKLPLLNENDKSDLNFMEKFIQKYGDKSSPGLVYKVQIAAYRFSQNFDYSLANKVGKIDKQILDDGITRFTVGNFITFNEAQELKNKMIQQGITDAFVLVFVNNKRTYLEELEKLKVFE